MAHTDLTLYVVIRACHGIFCDEVDTSLIKFVRGRGGVAPAAGKAALCDLKIGAGKVR